MINLGLNTIEPILVEMCNMDIDTIINMTEAFADIDTAERIDFEYVCKSSGNTMMISYHKLFETISLSNLDRGLCLTYTFFIENTPDKNGYGIKVTPELAKIIFGVNPIMLHDNINMDELKISTPTHIRMDSTGFVFNSNTNLRYDNIYTLYNQTRFMCNDYIKIPVYDGYSIHTVITVNQRTIDMFKEVIDFCQ